MYSASATFNTLIKEKERTFTYSGSIVTTGGTTYDFDGSDMRSGKIVRSIAEKSIEIGSVYASEFDCELGLSISRYELYNGTITLKIKLEGATDEIPMGLFTISEINQTADRLKIKAYDNMIKFDAVNFVSTDHEAVQLPYVWLTTMCTACGVTLGNTRSQIEHMPNGKRNTGYADVIPDAKSWRDVLGYLATYLGGYAYIGRDGKLYIGHYGSVSADTIPANFRYSSGLSDFRTTYDGIYAVYKNDGVQEYYSNSNSGGIILDIGTNPFLQITVPSARRSALKEIINGFNGIYYVPFDSDIPMNPLYDVGDVLKFTGNQADTYDYGAITEIVLTIGNTMHITCAGDNPRLAGAQDRFAKSVEGLSEGYSNAKEIGGRNFWMISVRNTEAITVGNTEVQVAEIEWNQSTNYQDIEMILMIDAELSDTARVDLRLNVDDDVDFEVTVTTDKALKGIRPFHGNNPQKIPDKGSHKAKVYMTVTDSPLTVGDLR